MAEVQTPAGASAKDTALMMLSIAALLAGIVAFYWYDELALPFRVAMVVAGLAAGAGLMWFTWYGREFWQFAHAARIERALRQYAIVPLLDADLAPKAARNFRRLRELGITIRKTADIIIGTFCIEHRHTLLHDDRDFAPMQKHLGLKIA